MKCVKCGVRHVFGSNKLSKGWGGGTDCAMFVGKRKGVKNNE